MEILLSAAIVGILLAYSFARFFLIPYIGFQFIGSSGKVQEVFVDQSTSPSLEAGDLITAVNGLRWDEFQEGFYPNPLIAISPGESVHLEVEGAEGTKTIEWTTPGFNMPEFWTRMINTWPAGYAFWLAGTAALLLARPKNERWALLVAFNYVTAIWFTAGGLSSWGVLGSALILRLGIWLSLPIYVHFHWNFPNRISQIPRIFWILLYMIGAGFVIAQSLGWVSKNAYLYAFLVAIGVSGLILLGRFIVRPRERREIGLLFVATIVAFAPALAVAFYGSDSSLNPSLPGLLFSIVALPGAYFFVVYRRQLGGLELRANRLISIYLFAVLLVTLALAIFPLFSADPEAAAGGVALTALVTTLATGLGFPSFQRFVERRLLQIPKKEERLLSEFAGKISTTMSEQNLADILKSEILPSLLVRQSALFAFGDGNQSISTVYIQGVQPSELPLPDQISDWAERPELLEKEVLTNSWVRQAFPLRLAGTVCGLWLLGRKDPDDFYHQNERELLASLADQMAIAMTNIAQARSLLALHKAEIERQEAERIHMARELHDDVLPRINEFRSQEESAASRTSNADQLIELIRRLMSGLRPPLLDQGLYLALAQLTEDLKSHFPASANLTFQVSSNLVRFDLSAEQHLFRIVQQAAENALKHGGPMKLVISGKIDENGVDLLVKDDGYGFELEGTSLPDLLRTRHFGLAGMSERAAMLGADLKIDSAPGKGTSIHLTWRARDGKEGS